MQYIDIVNNVISGFNEIPLTLANWSSSEANEGFYRMVKNAVKKSIKDVYLAGHYRWPFLIKAGPTINTIANTIEYSLPSDYKDIVMHSVFIEATVDDSARKLVGIPIASYNIYYKAGNDTKVFEQKGTMPSNFTINNANNKIILVYNPDKVYNINYDYYHIPAEIGLATDVALGIDLILPCVESKAKYYCNHFRDNAELAQISFLEYNEHIKILKRAVLPSPDGMTLLTRW